MGFDSQKAVVKTYTLMLYLLGEYPAPTGHRDKEHLATTRQCDNGHPAPTVYHYKENSSSNWITPHRISSCNWITLHRISSSK
jgi:hypothetical protein